MAHNFEMEFDAEQVTLIERYADGNVKQQFRLPMSEALNLADSLVGAHQHLHEHTEHGKGGH